MFYHWPTLRRRCDAYTPLLVPCRGTVRRTSRIDADKTTRGRDLFGSRPHSLRLPQPRHPQGDLNGGPRRGASLGARPSSETCAADIQSPSAVDPTDARTRLVGNGISKARFG